MFSSRSDACIRPANCDAKKNETRLHFAPRSRLRWTSDGALSALFWNHCDPPVLVVMVLAADVTVSVTGTLKGAGRLGTEGCPELPPAVDIGPELMVTSPV